VVVSAGERHWLGGRKLTVQAGESLTVIEKSLSAIPVGFLLPTSDWITAVNGGSNTSTCSSEAW
jgi:hypothetical protein